MKRTLLLLPLMLLTSCGVRNIRYFNVAYDYNYEDHYYLVHYKEDKEKKLYEDNVHYVKVEQYPPTEDGHIAYNEFYIKVDLFGTESCSLYVYFR